MRVLLDEMLDRRLARLLSEGMEATTVHQRGWSGKKNGELLEMAAREFDAFLTTDKGIPHQQDLSRFDLIVVLLQARSNSLEDLIPLVKRVPELVSGVHPGELVRVEA